MELPPIPPVDVARYNWQPRQNEPSVWQRAACGTETIVGYEQSNNSGDHDIYLATTFVSKVDVTVAELHKHAIAALVALRYSCPQVALTISRSEAVRTGLVHRPPQSTEEATQWAKSLVEIDSSGKDGMAIRSAVEADRLEHERPLDAFKAYIAVPQDSTTQLKGSPIDFLFACNHLFFDGPGQRIAVNGFFEHLANELSGKSSTSFDWAKSHQNLAPPASAFVGDEPTSGSDYETSVKIQLGRTMTGLKGHGTKPKSLEVGMPRTLYDSLSEEQTQQVLTSVKKVLGPGHTVNQVAYAALLLATLQQNPLPTQNGNTEGEPPYMSTNLTVDGRRYAQNSATALFLQTPGTMKIENVRRFEGWHESKEKSRETLLAVSKDVKVGFDTVLSCSSPLSTAITIMETIAHMLESGQVGKSIVTAPMLHGDGVYERTLKSDFKAEDGQLVFELTDCKMAVNQHMPQIVIRVGTFRNRLMLSCEYNEEGYDIETAQNVMKTVKDLLLSV